MPQPRRPGAGARADLAAPGVSRYRQLRAEFNAALVTLYERTALPVLDIAAIAGRTDRAIYWVLRKLGAQARRPDMCRPGVPLRLRRRVGPPPQPLDAESYRQAVADFQLVVQRLREDAKARHAADLHRATDRAAHRTAQTRHRMLLADARSLRHPAAAREVDAAAGAELKPRAATRPRRQPSSRPRLRPEWAFAEQRVLRQQNMRMMEAHAAKREAEEKARAAAPPPPPPLPPLVVPPVDPEKARRINEIAERYYARAEEEKGPRIRKLW